MEIYKSKYLSISKGGEKLIQEWSTEDLTAEDFQKELKTFLIFYEQVKPKSVLWLQENFKFQIPPSLYKWIESDIVKRQYETGLMNIGFTVSADMLSHLSVMSSFEKVESVIQPNFFTDKNIATDYLDKEVLKQKSISYKISKIGEKAKIDVELDESLLPKAIFYLKRIQTEQEFIRDNLDKMQSLTSREMEVFQLIVNGYSSKEIAAKIFVETSTIGTHRKHIIQKLKIKRGIDFYWRVYLN